jgi:two-component system, OmpR family, sensor histidine kinase BaeS
VVVTRVRRVGRLGPLAARLAVAFLGVALAAIALLTVITLLAARGGISELTDRQQRVTAERAAALAGSAYEEAGGWERADLRTAAAVASAESGHLTILDELGVTVEVAHAHEMRGMMDRMHGRHERTLGPPLVEPILARGEQVGTLEVRFPAEGDVGAAEQLGAALTRNVLTAAGLAGLLAVVAAGVVANRVTRPLSRLTGTVEAVAAGDLDARSQSTDAPGELGTLARAVDRMADTLERQDQLRRALVADVAHELRTPLAIALAECDALVDGLRDPDPDRLASIREEIVRLARLVEDLEALSAAESAGLHLEVEPLDLAEVIEDLMALPAPRLAADGLALEIDVEPAPVAGDALRLGQIATNLVTNAARFSSSGGSIDVTVRDGDPVTLTVTDDGPGIPDDELPHVFERFWQGRAATGTGGSGVGLAVVAELARAHDGSVHATNAPGRGARFVLALPRG